MMNMMLKIWVAMDMEAELKLILLFIFWVLYVDLAAEKIII